MISQEKADAATKQMFELVGRTLTQWSFVEQALSNIFTICVTPCPSRMTPEGGFTSYIDSAVPTAIFYTLDSFRPKLSLVDAALLARVPDSGAWALELRAEWSRLKEKTRKLSLRRNTLAHRTVVPAFEDDEEFWEPKLAPAYGSPAWWKETGWDPWKDSLKPVHVEHMKRAFCLINDKLRDFSKRLALSPELSERFDQLTVRQIRSLDRLNPKRAEWIRHELASPGSRSK